MDWWDSSADKGVEAMSNNVSSNPEGIWWKKRTHFFKLTPGLHMSDVVHVHILHT